MAIPYPCSYSWPELTKNMKLFLFLIFQTLIIFSANTQDFVSNLYGFKLEQYREVASNDLGTPLLKNKFDDGFEYEAYLLKPDTTAYIVFEYAAGSTNTIYSIQITGQDQSVDIKFKGLYMGMDEKSIEKALGRAVEKEKIGNYGEKWEYTNTNYSIEVNKGKLSSVKIRNHLLNEKEGNSKIPSFATIQKALMSNNNEQISTLVAPGIEIYYHGKTYYLGRSFESEIEKDQSKIYETLKFLSKDLDKVNTSDTSVYEENVRIIPDQHPMHVIKLKKGHLIKEIVFQYLFGKYFIWEINAEEI